MTRSAVEDVIDLTREEINLETMSMKRINGRTYWNDLVEESSQRYITTMKQDPPKIKITIIRGGNGEEHRGENCRPEKEVFAAMPRGNNHQKTDAAGRSSILRALLERASSNNIHSEKKKEEDGNLKHKQELEEKIMQKEKKKNETNKYKDKEKWKNIMTMIQKSAIQNVNLTCGGNCFLRRGTNESEISCDETISMHSGTDSQYERAYSDVSPKRREENEESMTKRLNDSIREKESPKQLPERRANFPPKEVRTYPEGLPGIPEGYPQGEHNYPRRYPQDEPEECPEDNLNFVPQQPGGDDAMVTRRTDPQEANYPEERAGRTCKIKKINKAHKKGGIKNKRRLIPYYRKIKSKIQSFHIYFLKKHIKLLKSMIKVRNKELRFERLKNKAKERTNSSTTKMDMETNQKDGVGSTSQSERAVPIDEATRVLGRRMNRDRESLVTDNRQTCDAQAKVTASQGYSEKISMETEEARLTRIFREKFKRREDQRVRREARVEHLKSLIERISEDDEIPSEEDRRLEREIDEAERMLNAKDRTKAIFRISENIYDLDDNEIATFDATVNLRMNPMRTRGHNQAILVALLMKDQKVKIETKVMGDVDMDIVKGIQFKIPLEKSKITPSITRPQISAEVTVPKTRTRIERPDVSRRKGESPVTIQPEEAYSFGSGSTSRDTSSLREEIENQSITTPTQELRTYRRKRSSVKRPRRESSESRTEDSEEER